MAERIDDLQLRGLKLVQDDTTFCFGIDAVLLADFSKSYMSAHTLDLCSGNGVVPLLLSAKTDTPEFSCVEIQQKPYELSKKSVALNGLEDRFHLYHMDLKEAPNVLPPHSFSLITCNPPYTELGRGLINPANEKAAARHEIHGSLSEIIEVCSQLLAPRGMLTMVHKPQRLTDILLTMRQAKLEPKTIQFVHKNAGSSSNLVLVAAMAGGGKETTVLPPLCLYNEKGNLTDKAQKIYER